MPPMGQMAQPPYEGGYGPPEGYDGGDADNAWQCGPYAPRCYGGWGGFETLMWWNRGRRVPALATTSSNPADEGVLDRPTTTTLFGDSLIGSDLQTGGRLTVGTWLDPEQTKGIGFRFTALEGDRTRFDAMSDGSTVLARPFFNAQISAEDSLLISQPGFSNGGLHIQSENDFLTGEVFGRLCVGGGNGRRYDVIGGYQFARLDDSLRFASTTNVPTLAATFNVLDKFATQNEFHGGMLGFMGQGSKGQARISWLVKGAVGNMRQQVAISGAADVNGTPLPGGLFTQPSNVGVYTRDRFAFIPEANVNLHWQLNSFADVSLGYSLIYIADVALAGNQIDRQVNVNQPAPPLRPLHVFNESDFWYQGLNIGLNMAF